MREGIIEHNTILNPGSTSETVSEAAGITVSGSATVESADLTIRDNVIRDLRKPPGNYTKYGILLTRGVNLTVTNNLVSGANTKQIEVRPGVRDSTIRDNDVVGK